VTYADGRTRLQDVTITVAGRGGRTFVATATEAEVGAGEHQFRMTGDVHLASNDGIEARGGEASYDRTEGRLSVPGPVEFRTPELAGTAVGAGYDQARDILWLHDQVRATIAPGGKDAPAEIVAGAAEIARRVGTLHFDRGARVTRGSQVLEADTVVAHAEPGGSRLRSVELRGAARITEAPRGAGSLERMAAHAMNLTYGADGRTLTAALLSGNAEVVLSGGTGRAPTRTNADWIDIGLAADGTRLTRLAARDRVELSVPGADGGSTPRVISAKRLEGTGDANGLRTIALSDNVEYREAGERRDADGSTRTVRSQALDLNLEPATMELDTAVFSGGVTLADGTLTGGAPRARYELASRQISLRGAGARPRVSDGRVQLEADRLRLVVGGRIEGDGDVRSELVPEAADKAGAGGPTRMPAMLSQEEPVFVTSNEVTYDSDRSLARYTGRARLWQGDTSIRAAEIELDGRTGNLVARTGVESTIVTEKPDPKRKEPRRELHHATARELVYEEAERRATYAGAARLQGPQGDVTGEKVVLFLDRGGDQVERAEASGAVRVRLDTRSATGDHLVYFAADERYVMRGAPVRMIAENCYETTGRVLTFFKSTDTISVDGNETRTRTQTRTKTGATCPEPPVR
jgi:lipopolysaccharide transport protein LptA